MKSVFISSTYSDLSDYRAVVKQAIERLDLRAIDMVNFGSQPGGASGVSLREVRKANIYIGIIAHRYGYIPAGMNKSVTEQEYDEAVKRGLPRLMYLVKPDYAWPEDRIENTEIAQNGLKAFRSRVEANEVRSLFTTPENLGLQVTADLTKFLDKQRRSQLIRWILSTMIAITAMVTLVLIADAGTRSNLIKTLGLASSTPVPSATITPLPTLTPTHTLASYDIGIAVAYFALPSDGSVNQVEADTLVEQINARLKAEIEEFAQHTTLSVGFLEPSVVGRVSGETSAQLEVSASAIAERFGTNVVLYGSISLDKTGLLEVQPDFYVAPEAFAEALEMTGTHRLGQPISVEGPLALIKNAMQVNRPLSARTSVMAKIFSGLTYYLLEDYEKAISAFMEANDEPGWDPTQGHEVVDVLIGNTEVKLASTAAQKGTLDVANTHINLAKQAYQEAITVAPNYARPYTGLASVFYLQWNIATQATGTSNKQLLDQALDYFDQAQQALDSPTEIGVRSKNLFVKIQIQYALWMFNADAFSSEEKQKLYQNFLAGSEQIVSNYDEGREPSVRELASESNMLMGISDFTQSQFEMAVEHLQTGLDLSFSPRRRMVFNEWLGKSYIALNETEDAIRAYEQALELGESLGDIPKPQLDAYEAQINQLKGRG